jgi:hypothetical protein
MRHRRRGTSYFQVDELPSVVEEKLMTPKNYLIALSIAGILAPFYAGCAETGADTSTEDVGNSEQSLRLADFETAYRSSSTKGTLAEHGTWRGDTGGTVMPYTSPSIAALDGGGYMIAFNGFEGLWLSGTSNKWYSKTGLGVLPTTSPSIAGLIGGGYAVAFQSPQNELWIHRRTRAGAIFQEGKIWGFGMAAHASPSIVGLSDEGYVVAFAEQSKNMLYMVKFDKDNAPLAVPTPGDKLAPYTSPSIARAFTVNGSKVDNAWQVAYQTDSGKLALYRSNGPTLYIGYPMTPESSPAVIATKSNEYVIAFRGANGTLCIYKQGEALKDTSLGMMPRTSPSITLLANSTYLVTYQSDSGGLSYYSDLGRDTNMVSMSADSNPSISPVLYGLGSAATDKPKALYTDATRTMNVSWHTVAGALNYRVSKTCNGVTQSAMTSSTSYDFTNVDPYPQCTYSVAVCYLGGLCSGAISNI